MKKRMFKFTAVLIVISMLFIPLPAAAASKSAQSFLSLIDRDFATYLSAEKAMCGYAVQYETVIALKNQLDLRSEQLSLTESNYKKGMATEKELSAMQSIVETLESDLNKAVLRQQQYGLSITSQSSVDLAKYDFSDIFFVTDTSKLDTSALEDAVVEHAKKLSIYEQQQDWIKNHTYANAAEVSAAVTPQTQADTLLSANGDFDQSLTIVPSPLDPIENEEGDIMPQFDPDINEDKLRTNAKSDCLELGQLYEDALKASRSFKRLASEAAAAEASFKSGSITQSALYDTQCALFQARADTYDAIGDFSAAMYELNTDSGGYLCITYDKFKSHYKDLQKLLEEAITYG